MMALASARERNHSMLKSRNLPLKLSPTPFCQGLPGSIRAVSMPWSTIHSQQRAGDELRVVVGAQVARRTTLADQPRQHLDDTARAHRPSTSIASPSLVHSSVTVRHLSCCPFPFAFARDVQGNFERF